MSNYTKNNNFTSFDGTGKVISGVEFDSEFDEIQTAIATKAEKNGAAGEDFTVNNLTVNGDITFSGTFSEGALVKAWVAFDDTGTISYDYRVDSVVRTTTGTYTVTLDANVFTSDEFIAVGSNQKNYGSPEIDSYAYDSGTNKASVRVRVYDISNNLDDGPCKILFVG